VGVGWYRAQEYQRLLDISVDADDLDESHEA
jgi:hypothetical protein